PMLLVDGHNLIGRTPGLSLAREEASREQVLQRVAAAKGSGGERVVVVFDGNRPGSAKEKGFGGVKVVYAPAHGSADEEILRRVHVHNPRTVTVITSDRQLADRALGLGARWESCEAFWARLQKRRGSAKPAEEPVTDPDEVDEWLAAFGGPRGGEGGGHKI
ncbi:MAG: NYN domain-containing protein, partial [Deferrisomatales bacterium]|nr:NYN domain-containing protein [Deferrisomatales bacterium]